jgi:hypothetical protein
VKTAEGPATETFSAVSARYVLKVVSSDRGLYYGRNIKV